MRRGRGAFVATAARGMNAAERERAMRRLARQLAIEARQMGATVAQVMQVVEEELETIHRERVEPEMPMRLAVVPRG